MTKVLTEKQLRALRACAYPEAPSTLMFWIDAKTSWSGPRRTLGSLFVQGLVDYEDQGTGGHWTITDRGLEVLRENEERKEECA